MLGLLANMFYRDNRALCALNEKSASGGSRGLRVTMTILFPSSPALPRARLPLPSDGVEPLSWRSHGTGDEH